MRLTALQGKIGACVLGSTFTRTLLIVVAVFVALTSLAAAPDGQPSDEGENWRAGEKKFAEFMEMTETLKQLECGAFAQRAGQIGFGKKPEGKAAQRTVKEIEEACGAPSSSTTQKDGTKFVLYGRLGYETVDGKTVTVLWTLFAEPGAKK